MSRTEQEGERGREGGREGGREEGATAVPDGCARTRLPTEGKEERNK